MKPEIILDKGSKTLRPVIIKTEVVQRPAHLHQGRMSVTALSKPQHLDITLARVDALKDLD